MSGDGVDVGARLAAILEAAGTSVLFGVPGGQTLPLYKETRARGLTHVVMRDERNAACAADAYSRLSGRVGVCDATVGPGVTNLVSGLAESLTSSIPVLALVADIRSDKEHLRRRAVVSQAIDQRALLAPVTKWIGRVEQPHALDDVVAQALRVATTGRPGPVAVEVPEDVFVAPAAPPSRGFSARDGEHPRFRSAPSADAIAAAASLIRDAQRPVVLAGGGVHLSDAASEVSALAAEQVIPVVTTINGKGTIDERSPLAAGVVGLFGTLRALRALDRADVVVALGCKLDQFTTHGWRLPHEGQRVVHVDVDGEELGRTGDAACMVVADAREAAAALRQALGPPADARRNWLLELPGDEPVPAAARGVDAAAGIDPSVVAAALGGLLDPGDVVVCDASYASGWGAAHIVMPQSGRRFVAPRGLAGIGWSAGAAVGARLAVAPPGRVVVLAGDGGWAYGMAEVETAARLGLGIVYVILNNSALAWINHGEQRAGIAETSTFSDIDFATAGRALGAVGLRVTEADELEPALAKAVAETGPVVVDVRTTADTAPVVSLRAARRAGGAAEPA